MITQRVEIKVAPPGAPVFGGACELVFDDQRDPVTVRMDFQVPGEDTVTWMVSRDLLTQGAYSLIPLGHGDVRVRYEGADRGGLIMCLISPTGGHVDVLFRQSDVTGFLRRASKAVGSRSADEERIIGREVDAFLAGLFEGGDRA